MTSLAQQLKRLALPQNDANLFNRREIASLLFNPKEAASTDRSTFYALGCNGLEELLGIEPAFEEFLDTLFSNASMNLERSVQSKEVNKKLDRDIDLFLTRLSPYLLLKPSLKCIEWLLHRFHIHVYNPDSLIACALPYHETKVFVRIIQLLKIDEPTNRWSWLHGLQKPGVPLARGTLLTHCYKDLGFMDFICSLVTKSVKAYSESARDGNCAQLRVIFSFYASTIVSALDAAEKITDSIIAKLLPNVQLGLKSSLVDYKAATYMIVCQLALKVVMEAHLVDSLAVHISKSLCKAPLLAREGLGCLIVLLQNQKDKAVGPKAYGHLCGVPDLIPTLQSVASSYDISPLLCYLLPLLIHSVITQSDEKEEMQTDVASETSSSRSLFNSLLQDIPLTSGLDSTVAKLLLEEYLSHGNQLPTEEISSLNQQMQSVVRLFESKYPGALDAALGSHVPDVASSEDRSLFHQFISLSMSSGKYEILADSDTSLMLSLKHPLPAVRNMAVEHLKEVLRKRQEGFDEAFLKEALLERLEDHVPAVVSAAMQALELYIDRLDSADTVSSLLSLLQRTDVSAQRDWYPVLKQAIQILDDPRVVEGNPELKARVGWELLPYLVVTSPLPDSPELQLALCVAETTLLSQLPLTKGWAHELQGVLKKTLEADMVGAANQQLILTLTKNLSVMDAASKRTALEEVAKALEKQKEGVREQAAFVVLSHTLLRGIVDLSETQHLLTAQKLYTLLEPAILELLAQPPEEVLVGNCPPAFVAEQLGEYLHLLRSGQPAQREQATLLVSLLSQFISSLKSSQSGFKGEMWWNPEKLDTSTCCYLRLLIRLFDVVITGASQGPLASSFRALLQLLFQVHLSNSLELFKFLSLLWGYSHSLGDQLECRVGALLQTQALYMGKALLAAQSATNLNSLASDASPVVPSLLVCLCSPVCEVRRAAVACLQTLQAASSSPFLPVVLALLKAPEELISDPSYLSQALGKLYEDALTAGGKKRQQQAAVEQLVKCVQSPSCPAYMSKALLRALQEVNGEGVLAIILPPLDLLLEQCSSDFSAIEGDEDLLVQLMLSKYNEQSAPLLAREPRSLEVLLKAMGTRSQPYPTLPSVQVMALEKITKAFFPALGDEKVQQRILGAMFDLLVDCKNPVCAQTVNNVFKVIAVDAELVANELTPAHKPKVSGSVVQTRRSMRLRKGPDASAPSDEDASVSWQRVTLILELLQHKKKLKRPQALVPVLFNLLARSLDVGSAEQGNMEYTKQLLLGCLLNICQKISPDGKPVSQDVLDEDKMNVELVVQCVRMSDMPQTHHHALLLLGTVAGIFPEKVLHNIMPIFTFMGANIMRLDDAYSFQVINKTVQAVIPALIQAYEGSSAQSEAHMECVVTKIMHVFTDALPHVPEHRRLPILSQLLVTLGPARFLWVLLLLLFKQHATQMSANISTTEKDLFLENDVDFWISICCEFEVNDQLASLINILKYLKALPQDKEEGSETRKTQAKKKEETAMELVFSIESHSSKEFRHYKFLSVSFMSQLLASNRFVGKVADMEEASTETLQVLQQSLLEEILCYIHTVARCVEENCNNPTAKFWRALLNKAYEVLDKVNSLLPTDTFIKVIRGLMGNQLPSVRRKAMELLNNKLQQKTQWQEEQVTALLPLTGDLLGVLGHGAQQRPGEAQEQEEQAINRQTALYSLKLLCRSFGAGHAQAFVPVLVCAVDLLLSPREEKNVMGSALLCIAEVTSTLKALAIPQLHRLMPGVLNTLVERKDLLSNEIYLLSAVTALQRVSETLPHFISPYLLDTLLQVTRLTRVAEQTTTCPQLAARLASLRTTLATKLPPRVLLPTVTKCYQSLVESQQNRLGPLMIILKEHIAHMEKDQLNSHQSDLTTFFLSSLDFRAQHCQGDLVKTQEIEGSVIDCLLGMVMKLSEVTFRPLFFKLFDWCKTDSTTKDRQLTFYRLSDCIAEKLKGLFVLFAGQLVKPFSDILRRIHATNTDEAFFDGDDEQEKSCQLLQYVLDCLGKIFLYDTQRFLSKERAEALMNPLVDQLENMLGGEEVYQARVTKHLVPCIGQFAVAMGDDSQWKVLNYQVLLKTRHISPKVRFSALLMVLELAGRLKENYMVLLPETIPFLAELMEDECEEVEHQVQKVINEMENILGEPLQSYF
ncbi:HEAT repeat-containing protein 1 [Clupea harengus]|uniref:HEAT repeat-containing protein 1 n=1 Tax=Clupea harengus TaxID=7950 RepID=A0A6P8GA51_CLUHA|nr:HEAT repeat-containing protein 1 [Clupea harengus]XP_031436235.1 HEAT repeat-containing protein 1 [Clupea harengus]